MRFFKFYEKSVHGTSLLQQHEDLKLNEMIFLGRIFVLKLLSRKGPKWAQNEVFQVL